MIRLPGYTSNALGYVHNPARDILTNDAYVSNSLPYVYKPQIGQRTKWTAVTGLAIMATANSNLDGTGTLVTVLTSSAANGTYIKTITLKSTKIVTRGMVRLYVDDGTNTDIISEIEIPARSVNSIQEAFAISIEVDFMLKNEWSLKASIQNGSEDTVITAEGLELSYP